MLSQRARNCIAAALRHDLAGAVLQYSIALPERPGNLPAAIVAWQNDQECGTHLALYARDHWHFDAGHYFQGADSAAIAIADATKRAEGYG
jgi:hypothetical protein